MFSRRSPEKAFLWTLKDMKEHHQGQKPRGGKAEMNSTKHAYREEVGNNWSCMLGPQGRALLCSTFNL